MTKKLFSALCLWGEVKVQMLLNIINQSVSLPFRLKKTFYMYIVTACVEILFI